MDAEREKRQKLFIRVCRDSGFSLDAVDAAKIAAGAMGCSPLEFWVALGSIDTMNEIASGKHPAAIRT